MGEALALAESEIAAAGRRENDLMADARDLTWGAIVTTAERMSDEHGPAIFDSGGEFDLSAHRRRSFRNWTVTEGFLLVGYAVGGEVGREPAYPEVFEPVRARPMLARNWREVRAVEDAAAAVGERLRSWARYLRDS